MKTSKQNEKFKFQYPKSVGEPTNTLLINNLFVDYYENTNQNLQSLSLYDNFVKIEESI